VTDLTDFASIPLDDLTAELERMLNNHHKPQRDYAARNLLTSAGAGSACSPQASALAGDHSGDDDMLMHAISMEAIRAPSNDERLAHWAARYFAMGHHRRPEKPRIKVTVPAPLPLTAPASGKDLT
jgi:hypothetical protein